MKYFIENGICGAHTWERVWKGNPAIPVISVWILLTLFSNPMFAQDRKVSIVLSSYSQVNPREFLTLFESPLQKNSDLWIPASQTEVSLWAPVQHPLVPQKMEFSPHASDNKNRVQSRKRKWIWIGAGALITGGVAIVLLANRTPGDLPEPPPLPQ